MSETYKQALQAFHDAQKVVDGIIASMPEDEATPEEWANYYEWLTDFADAATSRASELSCIGEDCEDEEDV